MSLINDALKKAQRQRAGDTPPSSLSSPPLPGGSPAPIRSVQKNDSSPTLLLVGGGVTVGLLLGVGAFWFLRGSGEKNAAPVTPPSATVTAVSAPKDTPSDATRQTPAATSAQIAEPTATVLVPRAAEPAAPTANTPAATTPVAASANSSEAAPKAPLAVETPPAATPSVTSVAPAAKPTTPGEPSEQMVKAIESFRIMGIRAAGGADAKVLMNDRVYRIGDLVDRALGIRLTAATANSLTFQDAGGATYTRNF